MEQPNHFIEFADVFMASTKYVPTCMLKGRQQYEAAALLFEEVQRLKEQEEQKEPRPMKLKSHPTISHALDRRAC